MIKIITSPDKPKFDHRLVNIRIFLGGGISNCPDWQREAINKLRNCCPDTEFIIINPRSTNFNKNATPEQIANQVKWEYYYINDVANVLWFWFPKDTMCPITLYELGKATQTHNNIIVGIDPDYARRTTMIAQLRLSCPRLKIYDSIDQMVEATTYYYLLES